MYFFTGFTMSRRPVFLYKKKESSVDFSRKNKARDKNIQPPLFKLPNSVETDKYSKKGSLLQGKSKFFPFWSFVIDLSIVLVSIFLMNFIKYGTLSLGVTQSKLFFLYLAVWFFASIFFDKFHISSYPNYAKGLKPIFIAWLSAFFLIINLLVFFKIYNISRFHLFGIVLIQSQHDILNNSLIPMPIELKQFQINEIGRCYKS